MTKDQLKNRVIVMQHFLKMRFGRKIDMGRELNACGTRGCLAGEAVIALANAGQKQFRSLIRDVLHRNLNAASVTKSAKVALGFSLDQAHDLFFIGPDGCPFQRCPPVDPIVAAQAIMEGKWPQEAKP